MSCYANGVWKMALGTVMTTKVKGKQKRVRRPPTILGVDVAECIRMNADSIWLSQNQMWEEIVEPEEGPETSSEPDDILF